MQIVLGWLIVNGSFGLKLRKFKNESHLKRFYRNSYLTTQLISCAVEAIDLILLILFKVSQIEDHKIKNLDNVC